MKEVKQYIKSSFDLINESFGYTLIELLVVVSIVGLLSTAAMNTYDNYVIRSNRLGAQAALHRVAAALNSYKLRHFNKGYLESDKSDEVLDIMKQLKQNTHYHFSLIINEVGSEYLLSAVPNRKTHQRGDGKLTLNQKGIGCWYEENDLIAASAFCDQGQFW